MSDAVSTDATVEPAKDATVEPVEPVANEADKAESSDKPHALEPGGERFKQVWSRAKQAEEKWHTERDARIAAEAKLETLREVGVVRKSAQADEKVFTWNELMQAVTDGKLTQAEALDYREKQVIRQAKDQARAEIAAEQSHRERTQTIASQINEYTSLEPALHDTSSELRQKVEREYQWLVTVHGEPDRNSVQYRALELNAVKNVLGPLESLKRRRDSERMTREQGDTHMDRADTSQRGGGNQEPDESKPPKGLTPSQIAHYEKMFAKSSAYPEGWKSVRAELGWARKPQRMGR